MADTNDIWANLPEDEGMTAEAPAMAAPAVEGTVPAAEATPVKPGGARKASIKTLTAKKLNEELNANPDQAQRFKMWSSSLEITHSLGFSEDGSYIDTTRDNISVAVAAGKVQVVPATDTTTDCFLTVTKANGEIISGCVRLKEGSNVSYQPVPQRDAEGNQLTNSANKPSNYTKKKDVPQLVGYIAKNIGSEPILILNSTCYKNENGSWSEGTMEKVTLNPGEETQMTKRALALTSGLIEYSGLFANGTIYAQMKGNEDNDEAIINSATFRFNGAMEQYNGLGVHSDTFKVRIDTVDDGGFYRVADEFKEHFAYLENDGKNKNKNTGGRRKGVRNQFDSNDIVSKMIRDAMNRGAVL